jgi:hypothetical protein
MRKLLLAGLLLGLFATASPALAQNGSCDRRCLSATLDRFLAAVVAKDPAKAELFAGFRQTQNSILTPAGEGVWKTISGIGAVDRRYFDSVSGQAAFYGIVHEGDRDAVVSLRLRVERGQITEAEWHVARAGDPGMNGESEAVLFDLDKLTASPPPQRTVPVAQRVSREVLLAATNSYFDGITLGSGRWTQAHPGCRRYENGLEVTGRPLRPGGDTVGFEGKSDCRSGYASLEIANVAGRRFPLVDVEAQVVLGSAVFVRRPGSPKRRNHFMEVFTLDGGRISTVHAAMFYVDPKLPVPNWPPYEGNFPMAPLPQPAG